MNVDYYSGYLNMKKLFILSILLLFISCNKSEKDLIKNGFEKYVKENFDNPSDYNEITTIEVLDTITKESLLAETLVLSNSVDSILSSAYSICSDFFPNKVTDALDKHQRTIDRLSYYTVEKLKVLILNCTDSYAGVVSYDKSSLDKQKVILDSIAHNMNDFNIIKYEIKARIKVNNNLKFKTYFGLINKSEVKIVDSNPIYADCFGEPEIFNKEYLKYNKLQIEYGNIVDKFCSACDDLRSHLLLCGIDCY